MMSHLKWTPLLLALTLFSLSVTATFKWTNTQTSRQSADQLDLWTLRPNGCPCGNNSTQTDCACCVQPSGCPCGPLSPQRCGQCGLETFCDNMCNLTISAQEVASRSGQAYGEIKSPAHLIGPGLCWYRFQAEPGQRVEIQVYRIKRVGHVDQSNQRCTGGFLQIQPGESDLSLNPTEVAICGQNGRYSPPLVFYQDFHQQDPHLPATVTMIFRIDEETTSSAQFLAHYSFTSVEAKETGLQLRGGTLANSSSGSSQDCDWVFEEAKCAEPGHSCSLASPGFPGIYPPNRQCRYLITAHRGSTIRLRIKEFNLPRRLCETHFVSIFQGASSRAALLQKFCGFQHPQTLTFKGESSILVEFRSGVVIPPINYNGFVADLEFLPEDQEDKDSLETTTRRQWLSVSPNLEEASEDEDEALDDYDYTDDDNDEEEDADQIDEEDQAVEEAAADQSCLLEFYGNETRSGRFSSDALALSNGACKIAFKGNPGDVLILQLTSFKLKGRSCESFIRIFVPQPLTRHGESSLIEEICSPQTRRPLSPSQTQSQGQDEDRSRRGPLLVNYSTAILDFRTRKHKLGRFKGVFKFHHVLTEGFPVPDTICDRVFSGRTGPLTGMVEAPGGPFMEGLSHLTRYRDQLRCDTSLSPTESQSVTVVVKAMPTYSPPVERPSRKKLEFVCETQCDNSGCQCLMPRSSTVSLDLVDHLRLVGPDGDDNQLGCFCGDFSHLLPITIISSSSVTLKVNLVSDSSFWRFGVTKQNFIFSASYAFHNEETCGPRRIAQPIGSLESPLALAPPQTFYTTSTYFHQSCQWFFDPPRAQQIVLKISTLQKGVNCWTWNATISVWDNSRPDKIGALIDLFCPEIVSKEYVLDISSGKIVISLRSLSSIPIHYRISWETRGLLPRNGVMSAGSKVAFSTASLSTMSALMLLAPLMVILTCLLQT